MVVSVKRKYEEWLKKTRGVVGVAVGNQHIIVYVEEITPEVQAIPKTLEGVPVEIKVVGKIRLLSYSSRYRPVPGGVSIGGINTGTLAVSYTHLTLPTTERV